MENANKLLANAMNEIGIIFETQDRPYMLKHTTSIRRFQNIIEQMTPIKLITVNLSLLKKICNAHKSRASNVYGYLECSSSIESKITREYVEECIKIENSALAFYALCIYLQNPYNISKHFFRLLISNFNDLFVILD